MSIIHIEGVVRDPGGKERVVTLEILGLVFNPLKRTIEPMKTLLI